MVKNLPAIPETQEIPFDPWVGKVFWRKEWHSPHSSILAWRIPGTEEPGGLQSMGLQRVGHDRVTNTFTLSPPKGLGHLDHVSSNVQS